MLYLFQSQVPRSASVNKRYRLTEFVFVYEKLILAIGVKWWSDGNQNSCLSTI
jgi:hypothetical protein